MKAMYNGTARAQGEPRTKSVGMERYSAVILIDGKMYQRRLCLAVSSFSHGGHLWLSSSRGCEISWCAGRVDEAT